MEYYKTSNHSKHLLLYHLIFVCKYREKVLSNTKIANRLKELSKEIAKRKEVLIHYSEVDEDHIHYMIETKPTCQLSKFVNNLKSFTTYHIWQEFSNEMSKIYWHEHTLFTDGHFVSSIGNVSQEGLRKYIEEQGNEHSKRY